MRVDIVYFFSCCGGLLVLSYLQTMRKIQPKLKKCRMTRFINVIRFELDIAYKVMACTIVSVRPFKYISGIVPRCSFWFSYSFFKSGQSLVLMRPPQPPPYSIKFLLRKALFTTIAISGFIFRREIEENPSLQNSSSGCFDRSAATCRAPLLLLWQISCPLFYALIRDVIVTSQIKCRITSKW